MTNTPTYILILFAAISFGLFYIIINWMLGKTTTEGLENVQYKYLPDINAPNSSIKFGISDLAIDISSACGFIKVDSQLVVSNTPTKSGNSSASAATPSPNSDDDYTVPYMQLQIYKMYNDATGYSNTSNSNIYLKMDGIYGSFFDSSQLGSMTNENIDQYWNSNKSITIDDALYNGFDYFVMKSGSNNRKCDMGLSSYFLELIKINKSNSATLLSLKNAYYSITKPRFLANTLSNLYWKNAQTLTNSDKGTYNSVLFVLNTIASIAGENTLDKDLSANNVAKIISSSDNATPFTMDSIGGYQSLSVAFELYRFVAYFQKNGGITSGDKSPAVKTTFDRFISGYPQYLKKVSQIAPESPLVFLLRNMPNDKGCPVISKLTPYANTIDN